MFLAWFQRSLWKHHMSLSDPTRQTGAAVWAARRRGPLRLRALFLSSAHAQAAAQQVRHPHERRLLLGEWGSTGGPAATSCDISGFPNGYSGDVFSFLPQALGCSVDVPTVSVSEFLDQLIDLFCFYNGPVRQSYQVQLHKYFCFVLRRFKKHLHQPSQKDQDVWQHNQWQVKGGKKPLCVWLSATLWGFLLKWFWVDLVWRVSANLHVWSLLWGASLCFIRSTEYDNKVNHTLWQASNLGPCETFRAMPLNSGLPPLCLNFL